MKKLARLLIIGWALLSILSCLPSGSDVLPTITPSSPTTIPPQVTPSLEKEEEILAPTPQPDDRQTRQNLLRSTVQIIALIKDSGQLQPVWTGSGTILTPNGFILTNAHVVSDPDPAYQPDKLGVAMTVRSDELPELMYLAEVRAIDSQLDLAVIQIASDLDGRPIDTEQLNLNYVPVGDSDLLELGDLLQILGYPGIGGETITFTEGVVSGFTRERGVEGRAYVKTDATIAGGNSGGLAADRDGQIIGIPTQVGYGGAERFADCRYLADTNDDGVIDQNDNCIPVGGFINALRPVNLAKPLIEAARMGIAPKPTPEPGPLPPHSAEPRFYNMVFAPDTTDNDQPTQIVTHLPSGATDIYAFWDYAEMTDGTTWEARWYHDGKLEDSASQHPQPWQGGERGNWWVSIYNTSGLDDGTYRVELYVEDELLADGSISVGGATSGPTFTNLIFSEGVTADDRPTDPTYLLPSGITEVYAFFDYAEMGAGMAWSRVWYHEGEQVATGSDTWDWGASGSAWVSITADEPLDPGTYRLEMFVEGTLVAASDFTVAGTQTQEAIGPIIFAAGVDAQGEPVNPGTAFPTGMAELHFFCTYAGMQNGMNFDEKWILNGDELITFNSVWEEGASGTFHDYIYRTSGEPLSDGQYTLELYVEGQLAQTATATVGTGTPPPTPTPPTKGLFIQGYVRDADTDQGITGAAYVVLNPGVTVDGWDGSDEQVYTWAQTGEDGYFELQRPLKRNEAYSIIVWAEGYRPANGDNIQISDEPSPLEVEITLQRE
ncbi:MAG: trypsin-like peptidase domain-containing protein [Chloroflexota bacterium]|nr:trypsin-like peptidase domain-containing protein [Chloroflexota bacterium]